MYFSLRTKLFLALAVLASALTALAFTPVAGRHGMVASSEPLASEVGVQILREGGNAVDAAVAVGFALAVTHPVAGNIGGGGFMLIRLASGEAVVVDYREAAPAAASRNMYVNSNGEIVPHASTVGVLSAGVPGTVAGLALAEEKYGKLGLARVIAPAVHLARGGFEVSYHFSESLRQDGDRLSKFDASRRISCGTDAFTIRAKLSSSRNWHKRSKRSHTWERRVFIQEPWRKRSPPPCRSIMA